MGLPQLIRGASTKDFRGRGFLGKDWKLWPVGALVHFVNGQPSGYDSDGNGVPDELALGSLDRW
jgi:hypothetical protein